MVVKCPGGHKRVWKKGSANGLQRYVCFECGRTFSVSYSGERKPLRCACCGCHSTTCGVLVSHHWVGEQDGEWREQSRWVCNCCNSVLTRSKLDAAGVVCPVAAPSVLSRWGDLNHFLPSWDIQVAFVRGTLSNLKQ